MGAIYSCYLSDIKLPELTREIIDCSERIVFALFYRYTVAIVLSHPCVNRTIY